MSKKTPVLMMGQTPPPWHGQAVATQLLFEHSWPEFEVQRLRMEFSVEMDEVGRFQLKKLKHLWNLIREARGFLRAHPEAILFYPPASANWVPFLRDMIFLHSVRPLAKSTVFIYHASGLPAFAEKNWFCSLLAKRAYHLADVSLEVAQEKIPAHRVFRAWDARWCPCAIEVFDVPRTPQPPDGPLVSLFVGSLQEGKGVLEVLKTAHFLKQRGRQNDFRFRIVGKWFSDAFERESRELHRKLGVEKMVDFVGQLTGDDKWQAYADADVFFFPTHYASEASPLVVMEALGMGCPVLSTSWAGIPALLEGCDAAVLLPIKSPEAYADALEKMPQSGPEREKMAALAKKFYQERFLPERFIGRVRDAFQSVEEMRKNACLELDPFRQNDEPIPVKVYLADQNPNTGRSLGISRMTEVVLESMAQRADIALTLITSGSSLSCETKGIKERRLPWSTRPHLMRLLTDHLHPLVIQNGTGGGVFYFPKGFLPFSSAWSRPSVVTIHDTIIQFYSDHYPEWRHTFEYRYWAAILKHTLRNADAVLTVSESSKQQIEEFMQRFGIPERKIVVTYEPCFYESVPQPDAPTKENYVVHFASREPHKRTAMLVQRWAENEERTHSLELHLIGKVPPEVEDLVHDCPRIVQRPFLEEPELQHVISGAKALIFPSEIEGFGLPAIEAYYLGTPVVFRKGTSVEEVLAVTTDKGGFQAKNPDSVFAALAEVLTLSPEEIRLSGLKLRDTYAATKVADRMIEVFRYVASGDQAKNDRTL